MKLYEACEGSMNSQSKCWMGSKELLSYSLAPVKKILPEDFEQKMYLLCHSPHEQSRDIVFSLAQVCSSLNFI